VIVTQPEGKSPSQSGKRFCAADVAKELNIRIDIRNTKKWQSTFLLDWKGYAARQ
jgi:hypothetical protein